MRFLPKPRAHRRHRGRPADWGWTEPRRHGLLSGWLIDARTRAAADCVTGASVLDAGCNIADLAAEIPPNVDYLGLELQPEVVALARRLYPDRQFEVCDLEGQWPASVTARRFDHVVLTAVVEHLHHPARVLARAAALLGPGGTVILTTPHPRGQRLHALGARLRLFSRDADEEHERFFDRAALSRLAERAGLRLVAYRRFQLGLNQLAVLSPVGRPETE